MLALACRMRSALARPAGSTDHFGRVSMSTNSAGSGGGSGTPAAISLLSSMQAEMAARTGTAAHCPTPATSAPAPTLASPLAEARLAAAKAAVEQERAAEAARAAQAAAGHTSAPSQAAYLNGGTIPAPDLRDPRYAAPVPVTGGSDPASLLRDVYAMMTRPPGQNVRQQIAQELQVKNAHLTPQHAQDVAEAAAAASAARSAGRPGVDEAVVGDDEDVDLAGTQDSREARRKVSRARPGRLG